MKENKSTINHSRAGTAATLLGPLLVLLLLLLNICSFCTAMLPLPLSLLLPSLVLVVLHVTVESGRHPRRLTPRAVPLPQPLQGFQLPTQSGALRTSPCPVRTRPPAADIGFPRPLQHLYVPVPSESQHTRHRGPRASAPLQPM
jgi:hypothetical protein